VTTAAGDLGGIGVAGGAPGCPAGHRLGPAAEIPLGEGRAYAVAGAQVAVFRPRDGSVYALSALCPHAGGPLADGQLDGAVVVCPLHLHAFELATGRSRTGQQSVQVFPVELDGGEIVVYQPVAG